MQFKTIIVLIKRKYFKSIFNLILLQRVGPEKYGTKKNLGRIPTLPDQERREIEKTASNSSYIFDLNIR